MDRQRTNVPNAQLDFKVDRIELASEFVPLSRLRGILIAFLILALCAVAVVQFEMSTCLAVASSLTGVALIGLWLF